MFIAVVTKEAQLDIDEIFAWYEEQKEGLGFDFISRFEIILHKNYRKSLLRIFYSQ